MTVYWLLPIGTVCYALSAAFRGDWHEVFRFTLVTAATVAMILDFEQSGSRR